MSEIIATLGLILGSLAAALSWGAFKNSLEALRLVRSLDLPKIKAQVEDVVRTTEQVDRTVKNTAAVISEFTDDR